MGKPRAFQNIVPRLFLILGLFVAVLGGWGQSRIPADPTKYLQIIGAPIDGARDLVEVAFFEIPSSVTGTLYFGINDAGNGGASPDAPGTASEIAYYLVGGAGALTDPNSRLSFYDGFDRAPNHTWPLVGDEPPVTGTILSRMAWIDDTEQTTGVYLGFAQPIDPDGGATGSGWVYFPGVSANQGELVGNKRFFKVVAVREPAGGGGKNAYQLDVSVSPSTTPTGVTGARSFAYSWTFAILQNTGDVWNMYPYVPDRTGFPSAVLNFRNFDMDIIDGTRLDTAFADDIARAMTLPTTSIITGATAINASGETASNALSQVPVDHTNSDQELGTWIYQVVEGNGNEPAENTTEFWTEYDENNDGTSEFTLRMYSAPFRGNPPDRVLVNEAEGTAIVGGTEEISLQVVDADGNPVDYIGVIRVDLTTSPDPPNSLPTVTLVNGVNDLDNDGIAGDAPAATALVETDSSGLAQFTISNDAEEVVTITLTTNGTIGSTDFGAGTDETGSVSFLLDPAPTMSSLSNTSTNEGVAVTLPSILINDTPAGISADLTTTNDIFLRIPSSLNAQFDIASGPASILGETAVLTLEDPFAVPDPRYLKIDLSTGVTNDGVDEITIQNLALTTTSSASSGFLEMSFDGGSTFNVVDDKVITIVSTNSNVWDGSSGNGNWSDGNNWSTGTVPTSTQDIVIPFLASGSYPSIDGAVLGNAGAANLTVKSLTIANGASLDLGGTTLVFTVSGTFSNDGVLIADGGETVVLTQGNDVDSGSIRYDGIGTYNNALPIGANYYDVEFVSAGTWNPGGAQTITATNDVTLGNGDADIVTFGNNLTVTAGGTVTIDGSLAATGTAVLDFDAQGLTVVSSATLGGSSTGGIFLGALSLADGVTLTVGAGSATPISMTSVSGTSGGATSNLTINTTSNVAVTGSVGTDLGNLTVTNSGGITFDSTVDLSSFTATDTADAATLRFQGNTTFGSLITAAQGYILQFDEDLTVTSDTTFAALTAAGGILFGDGIDDIITFTGGIDTTVVSGTVTTRGTVRTNGAPADFGGLTLGATTTIDTTNGGIAVAGEALNLGLITGATHSLTLEAGTGGALTLQGIGSAGNALTSLTVNAASTQLNSAIYADTQIYNDPVTLGAPVEVVALTGATFNSTVDAGVHAFTLTANEIDFAGGAASVSGSGGLVLQPVADATSIDVGSPAAGAGTLDISDTDLTAIAEGFSGITIGRATGTHTIAVGTASFKDAVTIRTPAGGSTVVNGQLDTLSSTLADAAATVVIDGSGATTTLSANIVTKGAPIDIQGAVDLAGNVSIDTTNAGGTLAGANIQIDGAITRDGTARNLTLEAGTGGDVVLTGAVGTGGAPLGALTISSANNVAGDVGATVNVGAVTAGSFSQSTGSGTTRLGTVTLSGAMNLVGSAMDLNGAITAPSGFSSSGTTFDSTGASITTTDSSITIDHTGNIIIGGALSSGTGALDVDATGVGSTLTLN
ncbi:MAG: hypothetical protein GW949_08455, partial [Spirochaetales bacterium]|nr:hypothetical protein [Spirochaetales bacterium]